MAALVEDYECCVCMVAYNKERPPKNLICGHSFCPPCLVSCCTDKDFTCPTCNQPHNLRPATVNSLPTNYGLLGVAQRAEEAARRPQCQLHQRPWESRCMDCKRDLCLDCLINDSNTGAHTGHNVINMNNLAKFLKSELSQCEIKVNKAYRCLLEKNDKDNEIFQQDIVRLKSKINSDSDEAIKNINENRKEILLQLDTRSREASDSVQKSIRKVNDELEILKEEISSSTSQITDENLVNVQQKATALVEIVSSFEPSAYFPKIDIAGAVSVKLATLSIEEPPSPPTLPALSALSLGPESPPTQRVPSQEQPEASGQSDDLAASNTEPSPTPASDVSLPYRQYASHGSFRVSNEFGTTIHLCCGDSWDDVRRLVETMIPPPDALVWGTSLLLRRSPPRMPPTTETISVDRRWDAAVRGLSQAERNQRRAVALVPYTRGPITELVDHLTSGRQPAAAHVIVVDDDQNDVTRWQQQLREDQRVIPLQ